VTISVSKAINIFDRTHSTMRGFTKCFGRCLPMDEFLYGFVSSIKKLLQQGIYTTSVKLSASIMHHEKYVIA
jgi:hypothetical protein